jgi:hypothetical protein
MTDYTQDKQSRCSSAGLKLMLQRQADERQLDCVRGDPYNTRP